MKNTQPLPPDPPSEAVLLFPRQRPLTFQVERFRTIERELPALFYAHWLEVAIDRDEIPLDPNYDQYLVLDDADALVIQTARRGKRLAGYFFSLVLHHLHYMSTKVALTDIYYLDSEARRGMGYPRFFRFVANDLKRRGVKKHWTMTKCHLSPVLGQTWERMGYRPTETVYTKILEG